MNVKREEGKQVKRDDHREEAEKTGEEWKEESGGNQHKMPSASAAVEEKKVGDEVVLDFSKCSKKELLIAYNQAEVFNKFVEEHKLPVAKLALPKLTTDCEGGESSESASRDKK